MFRKSMSGIKKKREPKECSTTTCMSQKLKTAKFFDEQQKRPKKYIAFTVDCCLTGQTFQRYQTRSRIHLKTVLEQRSANRPRALLVLYNQQRQAIRRSIVLAIRCQYKIIQAMQYRDHFIFAKKIIFALRQFQNAPYTVLIPRACQWSRVASKSDDKNRDNCRHLLPQIKPHQVNPVRFPKVLT